MLCPLPQCPGGVAMKGSRLPDETILAWVRRRAAGESVAQIAPDYGVTPGAVRTTTIRVMTADLAESGEDPRIVARAYW